MFVQAANALSVHYQLYNLWQGRSTIPDYVLHFRTLTAACSWDETALFTAYGQGLSPSIHAQMAIYYDNVGL